MDVSFAGQSNVFDKANVEQLVTERTSLMITVQDQDFKCGLLVN